jgi:hypothetical protein
LNRDDLLRNGREEDKLFVTISYDANDQILRVVDDSSGMTLEDLESSLEIGRSKEKTVNQLSEFGMGMKTSAIWLGNLLTIRTKHYSSELEYYVEVDIAYNTVVKFRFKGGVVLPVTALDEPIIYRGSANLQKKHYHFVPKGYISDLGNTSVSLYISNVNS